MIFDHHIDYRNNIILIILKDLLKHNYLVCPACRVIASNPDCRLWSGMSRGGSIGHSCREHFRCDCQTEGRFRVSWWRRTKANRSRGEGCDIHLVNALAIISTRLCVAATPAVKDQVSLSFFLDLLAKSRDGCCFRSRGNESGLNSETVVADIPRPGHWFSSIPLRITRFSPPDVYIPLDAAWM